MYGLNQAILAWSFYVAYIAEFMWGTGKISKTTKPILLDSLYKAEFTCME